MLPALSEDRNISGAPVHKGATSECLDYEARRSASALSGESSGASFHERAAEDGQALLEFALCLPVLLLTLTGICSFGVFLTHYLALTNAVTIGAQQLAVSRGQTTDPCQLTSAAVQSASPMLTGANLSYTFVLNGATYKGTSCSSGSTTTGAAGNLVQGGAATVTVTYPCSLAVYGKNYVPNCLLQAQTTELVQ